MFDEPKSKVSLGGRKSKTQAREQLLSDARARRQQRAVAAAPSKGAILLGRCSRGWLARKRAVELLRASLTASADSAAAPDAAERSSIARRLAMLHRLSSSCGAAAAAGDPSLVEACCSRLLSVAPPLGDGPSGSEALAYARRASLLLPMLAQHNGDASSRLLGVICCGSSSAAAEGSSSAQQARRVERALLLGVAPSLFRALSRRLFAEVVVDEPQVTRLVALCRSALGVGGSSGSGGNGSGGSGGGAGTASSSSSSSGGGPVADASVYESFAATLPLVSWLGLPPQPARTAALRALFCGWVADASSPASTSSSTPPSSHTPSVAAAHNHIHHHAAAKAKLEAALAQWARGWLPRVALAGGDPPTHAIAQLLVTLVASCCADVASGGGGGGVASGGADWRGGGWVEGRPRRLREVELEGLLRAQVLVPLPAR